MTQGDFQSAVNVSQAPGVEGDFCDKNPRYSFDAGPGGLVAGPDGAIVGRFAWAEAPVDGDGAPSRVSTTGFGPVSGFVHREQQGLIVDYLASSGLKVQAGFGMTLMIGAGLWALNTGNNAAVPGMKAYANFADGKVTFNATGTPTAGGTSTASTIAAGTFSVTGSIANDVLNVTVVGSGVVRPGSTISGTNVITGTQVVEQISGTPGGVGEYVVNFGEQDVDSTTISGTYGLLTIGGTVAGTFAVGQTVTGSGITDNTHIRQAITGLGGAGTYAVDISQVVSSQAINTAANVETKWYARSQGLPGEIVKISDQAVG
jgi:hypothetical protein